MAAYIRPSALMKMGKVKDCHRIFKRMFENCQKYSEFFIKLVAKYIKRQSFF